MINQLKADLHTLEQELEVNKTRARLYAECGLKEKAEQFAKMAENGEKLTKAYKNEIKKLEE